jgi:hypothetical protein
MSVADGPIAIEVNWMACNEQYLTLLMGMEEDTSCGPIDQKYGAVGEKAALHPVLDGVGPLDGEWYPEVAARTLMEL